MINSSGSPPGTAGCNSALTNLDLNSEMDIPMRKNLLSFAVVGGVLGGALLPGPAARAYKPFTPVTKMYCERCHDTRGNSWKTLRPVGDRALETLKKGGYPFPTDAKSQKAWAEKLLKDFKG